MTNDIKHWSEYKYSENMLQDALIKHVMDLMPYRMSDEGEVLEVTMNLIKMTKIVGSIIGV
jgi:hypothetical protein